MRYAICASAAPSGRGDFPATGAAAVTTSAQDVHRTGRRAFLRGSLDLLVHGIRQAQRDVHRAPTQSLDAARSLANGGSKDSRLRRSLPRREIVSALLRQLSRSSTSKTLQPSIAANQRLTDGGEHLLRHVGAFDDAVRGAERVDDPPVGDAVDEHGERVLREGAHEEGRARVGHGPGRDVDDGGGGGPWARTLMPIAARITRDRPRRWTRRARRSSDGDPLHGPV